MPIKDLLNKDNGFEIEVLPNEVSIWREDSEKYFLSFMRTGAIFSFKYNQCYKYLKEIIDSPIEKATKIIKNKFRGWI